MITEDLDVYLDIWGRPCTWTPAGGSAVSRTLIVNDTRGEMQDGAYQIRTREIAARGKASDLAGIADDDVIATSTDTYVVEDSYLDDDNPEWMILVLGIGG